MIETHTNNLKRLLLIVSAIVFAAPCLSHAATINMPTNFLALNTGLVGWWTMDGKNLISNVTDSSGSGINGYFKNFPATTTAVGVGENGQALRFNGTNDYVLTNNANPTLNITTNMTVSAWIRLTAAPNSNMAIVTKDSGGESYWLGVTSGKLPRFEVTADGATGATVTGTTVLAVGKWYHIVGKWDTDNNVKVYLNGSTNYSSPTAFSGPIYSNGTANLYIGHSVLYSTQYFPGYIDDVRVYNRALSDAEISELYNASAGSRIGKSSALAFGTLGQGLVGWWTMDGKDMNWTSATAGSANDISGNGNTGMLYNMNQATSPTIGKIGQALKFNGTNSYVDLGASATIAQIPGSLTLSAWVYDFSPSTSDGGDFIFERDDSSDIEAYALFVDNGFAGSVQPPGFAFYYEAPNSNYHMVKSPNITQANKWYHVVGVYDSVANKEYIYENGQLVNSVTPTLPPNDVGGGSETIGTYACCGHGNYFNGLIDDVRIYNRALSASEVAQLYTATGGGRINSSSASNVGTLSQGLVGWWTFDGKDMIQNVADESGSGNNGDLVSFTSTTTVIGKIGQALKFDGINNFLSVPGPTIGTSNSIILWVYPTSFPGSYNNLVGQDSGTALQIEEPSQKLSFGGGPYLSTANTALKANQWQQVGMVNNNGTVTYYYNGQSDGTPSGNNAPGYTVHMIGNDESSETYAGVLDDVRVYNRALSAAEVKQLYNMGK